MSSMMIGRRRLLSLTAAGVSVAALGGLSGARKAYAADRVRWVSPRGTIEVLDDYPYWVGKKYGYFGNIETTLEPGPSDATACVKLVDQNQADMGYPSPGVFSLGLAQGIPLVSVFHMGGADVFDFAFRKGEKPADIKGIEGKTIGRARRLRAGNGRRASTLHFLAQGNHAERHRGGDARVLDAGERGEAFA